MIHRHALALGLIALTARPAAVCAENGPAAYQANDWDKQVTLPPNAYRASRTINLDGKFSVKTEPGTSIDNVHFEGINGDQHWFFNGTLLHGVRVGGQLGVSGKGVDSVFEDCEFNKDSNWYVRWWSTRWEFENCIFTKRFIRGDLPPLDYAAHATRCTFYGVKLPGIGFQENAAGYLQSRNMGFQECRFVDCDVPETFLAATVNCLFEHCRFAPKGSAKWPGETGPIKVTAFYEGLDGAPTSFMEGPLSVEFKPAPREAVFGSSLAHSRSGEYITLTNLHLPENPTQLGSLTKKASEIVDVSAADVPPAPTPASPAPTPAPGAADVRELDEMLAAIPSNIELMSGGEPDPVGIEAANAWLTRHFAQRPAAMRLTLDGTQVTKAGGYAYEANARPQGLVYHGDAIVAHVVAMFRANAAGALSHVQHNEDFNVRGTILGAALTAHSHAVTLTAAIGEAHVDASLPAAPASPPANPPPPPDTHFLTDAPWTFTAPQINFTAESRFTDQGEWIIPGLKTSGTWKLENNQLKLAMPALAAAPDLFGFPAQPDKWQGVGPDGQPVFLSPRGKHGKKHPAGVAATDAAGYFGKPNR